MAAQVLSTVFLLKRGTAEAWNRHNQRGGGRCEDFCSFTGGGGRQSAL